MAVGGYPAGAVTRSDAPYNQKTIKENTNYAKGIIFDSLDREFYISIPYNWFSQGSERFVTWYLFNQPANAYILDTEKIHEQIRDIIRLDLGGSISFEWLSL